MDTTYFYKVLWFSNYDGDSFKARVLLSEDAGFGIKLRAELDLDIRIKGIDTTELRDSRKDFKALAYKARDKAREWAQIGLDKGELYFASFEWKEGMYGRALGDLVRVVETANGSGYLRLTEMLHEQKLAVLYSGKGSRKELEPEHKKNIEYHGL